MNKVVIFIKGKDISLDGVRSWHESGNYTGFVGAEKIMWFPTRDIEGFMLERVPNDNDDNKETE
jgi:hypothetical protein